MHDSAADITDDAILNGRLRLLQPKRGHRFGHDAILLAAAVPAQLQDRVAEFGAGVGAASLALLSRIPGAQVTLFEIDEELCALARENIARNGFSDRADVVHRDIAIAAAEETSARAAGGFDHVFMNPPFNPASLLASPDPARRTAHAGDRELLRTWVNRAHDMLGSTGSLTLIWRADGLNDVLQALAKDFGGITVTPIYPAPGRAAIRIIASGYKQDRSPLRILPPLTLNDRSQTPTDEAEAILRHGGAWPPDLR
jgi:tRNA1(Val) A37 N6-methylase TrmN6